jgi:hypothetical protein
MNKTGFLNTFRSEWVLYIKNFSDQKIMVQFPNDPSLTVETYHGSNILKLKSSDENAKYSLIVMKENKEEPEEQLLHILSDLKKEKLIEIQETNLIYGSSGLIADFHYRGEIDSISPKNEISRGRILIKDQNTYCFYTTSFKGQKGLHDRFIGSFQICC